MKQNRAEGAGKEAAKERVMKEGRKATSLLELEAQSRRPHPALTACHEDAQHCQGAGCRTRVREAGREAERTALRKNGLLSEPEGVESWSPALASHPFLSSQPWLRAWLRAVRPGRASLHRTGPSRSPAPLSSRELLAGQRLS